MDDPFIRNYVEDLLVKIRTQVGAGAVWGTGDDDVQHGFLKAMCVSQGPVARCL